MALARSTSIRYLAVGSVALALAYGILFLGAEAVDFLFGEDGLVEWAGAIALFVAFVGFSVAFVRAHRLRTGLVLRLSLLVLALVFLFGAGEEVSWGQRIFGIETPETLSEVNSQDEITVHNLSTFDNWIELERLFQVFWVGFAVLIPLACGASERLRTFIPRLIPVFPLWLAGLFVMQQLIAEGTELVVSGDPSIYAGEIDFSTNRFELTETLVAVLFAIGASVVAWSLWGQGNRLHEAHGDRSAARSGSA